jgi:hypothetical protein
MNGIVLSFFFSETIASHIEYFGLYGNTTKSPVGTQKFYSISQKSVYFYMNNIEKRKVSSFQRGPEF